MKKFLLLGTALLACSSSAFAIEDIFPDEYLTAISPDGKWVAGDLDDGSIIIREVANPNNTFSYFSNGGTINYHIGIGSPISNTGVVVGSTTGNNAAYWENGEWYVLTVPNPEYNSTAQSITPDGKYIVGGAGVDKWGLDTENLMLAPAIWERQADGSYSDAVILPHPSKDFTGRTPQYITAVAVSEDGNTVAGQIRDYTGYMEEPIVYTRNDAGEWSYTLLYPELLNPTGIEFPEYPGEFTEFMPTPEWFMTDEEMEDFQNALQEYWNGERDEFPEYEEFMTMEEYSEYLDAMEEYNEHYFPWAQKWDAFEKAYQRCLDTGFVFEFNSVQLTADGKYYISSRKFAVGGDQFDGGTNSYFPVILNVDGSGYKELNGNKDMSLFSSCVSAKCDVLATQLDPLNIRPHRAYIFPAGETTAIPLEDYIATISPSTAQWMIDEMTHNYAYALDEKNQFLFKEFMCSGTPVCTPDLSMVVTYITTDGWEDADAYSMSYLFNTGLTPSVVEQIAGSESGMTILNNGSILLTGNFATLNIYNIAGAKVYSAQNLSGNVSTGLQGGIYIVKAVAADGTEYTRKVAF